MRENGIENIQKKIKPEKKKWKRIISLVLVILLIIVLLPPIVVSMPFVQTFIVGKISDKLSEQLHTNIRIKSVNITFFNRVRLNGIYVEDTNRDTLMYVSRLDALIGNLPLNGRPLTLNKLRLSDGIFCLRSDSTGTNITKLIRKLKNPDRDDNDDDDDDDENEDESSESAFRITTKSLELKNFRYVMHLNDAPSTEEQPEGIIYKNMSVSDVNLDADRISIKNDTLTFRVNDFSFRERSGLNVRRMIADTGIIRFGKEITFREFRLIDDFSDVRMRNLSLLYNGGREFSDFVNKVKFVVDIYNSRIDFATLGYFAPILNKIPVTANFNGQVTGHIADLRSDDFAMETLDNTYIEGRFSIFGLPDIENTMIFVDLKHLDTRPDNVTAIVEGFTGRKFEGAEILKTFGNVHFNGTYTGFVNDFVSYGYLKSDLGDLEMDILFNNRENSTRFKGELATTGFNVGELAHSSILGQAGFNVMVNGAIKSGKNDIFGKGTVSLLEFNDYRYHNIELEGRLLNQSFDGTVKISEPNLDLDFNGNIDLAGQDGASVFNFDAGLKHVDLAKLKLNQRDTVAIVDANIKANFKASSILDYTGELTVDSLFYHDNQGKIDLGKIVLSSYNRENKNYLELKSGFMDAKYFGQNDLGSFVEQLQYIAQSYIPELFPNKTGQNPVKPEFDYDFEAHIKETKGVTRILIPDLYLEKGTELTAKIDTCSKLNLSLTSDKISYGNNQVSNLKLLCNNDSDSLDINLSGNFDNPLITLNNFNLDNSVSHDKILTSLSFADSVNDSRANLSFVTQFAKDHKSTGKLLTSISMNESDIIFFGQKWNLERTLVKIEDDRFDIDGFNINQRGQKVEISGAVSQNPNDSLKISLTNYRLRGINQYISPSGYRLGGKISGEIELCGLYGTPMIISSIQIDTLVVNSDTIGNIIVGSMWNNDRQRIEVTYRTSYGRNLYTSIFGHIDPISGEIYADIDVKSLKINIIEPLVDEILSDISGMINGTVKIRGTTANPDISGNLSLNNAGLTVNYLQTHYTVNSDIDITGSKISIYNGQIKDVAGNTGTLTMNLTHDYFKNIEFEANANVRNFLCLNTKSNDNPLFYGTAYTSGVVNLMGTPDLLNFLITAETSSNSTLYIPLSSVSQAKEYDFLSFTDNAVDTEQQKEQKEVSEMLSPEKSNMKLKFDLAVTPNSEIQILIDPKVSDILKAKGSGNLKIDVDPSVELFSITGDYSIEEGEYNFTLPNFSIVSRRFSINKGSRIHFNGDIENAELNVTASYKERVSLSALFPGDSLRNYPVECQILITGRMTHPNLKFNVDILNIDPEKKAQFANLVNTDEKMTRQFLALLVFKSFLPEQNFASQDLGTISSMFNASELLSGQLSSLISMFNLPIPLDVNVDYNANAYNSSGSGFGIDVSAQLFDRVILNGSASNSTTSNRSFVGDIEMEVLLGKNENTRFKVFSKSRDYFSDDMESNRNGIGLSYRSQFDKFIDIFRRKNKKKK
ncbi:MAG: translocation/assembly module TamB [Prevotellaceae bacterium]|nr:translocation/assembly module TamB [Prevotellaceae bacterium]